MPKASKKRKLPLTVFTAERDSEWNTRCEPLEPFLTASYPVRYLSDNEIRELLAKLEANGALGLLQDRSPDEKFNAFKERAQRQLLVALHEATLGRPFEEIVANEFERITPESAKYLYLDVCTLNRFGLPVRAGVISRISGIHFDEFKAKLFAPLEKIVFSQYDKYIGDRVFRARHPHVAEIVFSEVLADPEAKLDQILRMVRGLNISYSVDKEAFDHLTRGRTVAETFPSVEMGRALYRVASEVAGEDAYILHQEGVFELNHGGGSLDRAEDCLIAAERQAGYDPSIQHSLATLYRKKANVTENELLRSQLRKRALGRLSNARKGNQPHPYEVNTRLGIMIDELREILPSEEPNVSGPGSRLLLEKIKEIENELALGRQLFPRNEYLHATEATYHAAITDHPRAIKALEEAFQINPRQEWIAVRLADLHIANSDQSAARAVLEKAVSEHPTAKRAHLKLGIMKARSRNLEDRKISLQHFRSAFSNGDDNYTAQLWYGRGLFIENRFPEADEIFASLKAARVSPSTKNTKIDPVPDNEGRPQIFRGKVVKREAVYLFIESNTHGRDIFCHESNVPDGEWSRLEFGADVKFNISFNFHGPIATAVYAS